MRVFILTGMMIASSFALADGLKEAAKSNNKFGFSLFEKVKESTEEANVLVSPLSATAALTMTLNGADGDTRLELEKTLNLVGTDYNKNLSALLKGLQTPEAVVPARGTIQEGTSEVLSLANAIWSNKSRLKLEESFKKTTDGYYNFSGKDSLVRNEDFGSAALKNINNWVSENTNEMIPTILDELDPDAVAVLLNALFFQAQWFEEFDIDQEKLSFTTLSGKGVDVESVSSDQRVQYMKDDSIQAVSIPFRTSTTEFKNSAGVVNSSFATGVSRIKLDVLLPNESVDLVEVASDYFEEQNYQLVLDSMKEQKVKVILPKFKFDFKTELKDILKELGVVDAFDDSNADFSKMGKTISGSKIFISKVIQKTAIELDEKGLKAAAATAVVMMERGRPTPAETIFKANRAFLFVLRDSQTNAILFAGQLGNPEQPKK